MTWPADPFVAQFTLSSGRRLRVAVWCADENSALACASLIVHLAAEKAKE